MAKPVLKLINEAELFARMATGDERAFEAIYHHYNPRLVPFVQKMLRSDWLSEEVIQDVFIQLWVNRSQLADVKHPTSYLFNMATHKTLDYLKKIGRNEKMLDRVARYGTELSNETEERIIFNESSKILEEAVAALPNQRRLIYQLSHEQGLSHDQIAAQLKLSKQTVKNQLSRALKDIRQFMEKRASLFVFAAYFIITHS